MNWTVSWTVSPRNKEWQASGPCVDMPCRHVLESGPGHAPWPAVHGGLADGTTKGAPSRVVLWAVPFLQSSRCSLVGFYLVRSTTWQDPLRSSTLRSTLRCSHFKNLNLQGTGILTTRRPRPRVGSSMWSTGKLPCVKAIVLRYVNAAPSQVSRWHPGQNGKRTVVHEGPLG